MTIAHTHKQAIRSEPLAHKVADLSQADWGRKEITLAEQEMPGLM